MELLSAAGLPSGVVNMVTGGGAAVSEVALVHEALAGIHFTGSTATFRHLWGTVADEPRAVPVLPAAGRRDRRQGLRRRARERGPRRRRDGAPARRVRLPGPEVLGRVPRLPAAVLRRRRASSTGSPTRRPPSLRRRRGPLGLRRRGHRPAQLRPPGGRARGASTRTRRSRSSAGGRAQDKEGYFVEPTVVVGDRPRARGVHDRVLRPDPVGARLRRRAVRRRARARRLDVAVRADRGGVRDGPRRRSRRPPRRCDTRRATSTSTTSRRGRSSASSPSAAREPRGRTTRRGRSPTSSGG